jgi:hypothetical protein
MSYRTNAFVDARRAALEELRTAHRILLATPPPGRLERFFMMWNRATPEWPSEGQKMWPDAGARAASELEHACLCIRRALAHLDGVLRIDLRRVDTAHTEALDQFVVDLFEHVRDAEPPLRDVDPLFTE